MVQRKKTSVVHYGELLLTYFKNEQGGASFFCETSKKKKMLRNLCLCTLLKCGILERFFQSFNLATRKLKSS